MNCLQTGSDGNQPRVATVFDVIPSLRGIWQEADGQKSARFLGRLGSLGMTSRASWPTARHRALVIALAFLLLVFFSAFGQPESGPAAANRATSKRFVVVAPRRFRPALGDYLRHKQKQLPTSFVALEAILASSQGVDDPEKLK